MPSGIHILDLWLYRGGTGDEAGHLVVQGLRVTRHQETPGIADFITQPQRPWLQHLVLLDADEIGRVQALTGATITSRAILRGLNVMTAYPALTNSRCLP